MFKRLKRKLRKHKYFYTEINGQRFLIDMTTSDIEDYNKEEMLSIFNGYFKGTPKVQNTKIYYSRKRVFK